MNLWDYLSIGITVDPRRWIGRCRGTRCCKALFTRCCKVLFIGCCKALFRELKWISPFSYNLISRDTELFRILGTNSSLMLNTLMTITVGKMTLLSWQQSVGGGDSNA